MSDRITAWSRFAGANPQPNIHLRQHLPVHFEISLARYSRNRERVSANAPEDDATSVCGDGGNRRGRWAKRPRRDSTQLSKRDRARHITVLEENPGYASTLTELGLDDDCKEKPRHGFD